MPSVVLLQRDHEASPKLRMVIDATSRFWVCGTVHTVEEGRQLIHQSTPDIVVTDMRVQDGPVQPLLAELRQNAHRLAPSVVVTMVSHDDTALLEALRAGADGYWVHTQPHDLLTAALDQVWRGESPISPTIARQLLSYFRSSARSLPDSMTTSLNPLVLTSTEEEILHWVAQGYLIDEIAQQWQSTAHTVACGIRRVYDKLHFDLQAQGLSRSPA